MHSVSTNVYGQAVAWSQVLQLRLVLILIAPMVIMITTILLVSFTLYRAQNLCQEYNISFDPMNVLHVITACSSGNLQTIPFPNYSEDIGAVCEHVNIELRKGQAGNGVEGFQCSQMV